MSSDRVQQIKKDQFQLDWSMSDPRFREVLDYPVAESGLVDIADKAACGQILFKDTSAAELAPMLRKLSECFEKAADRITEMEKNSEGDKTGQ